MSRVGKYVLAYLGTAGFAALAVAGILLLALVDRYNDTRRVDVPLAALTLVAYTMAQSLLSAAVAAYAAARSAYEPPPIPQLPPARTVALIPAYKEQGRVGNVVQKARKHVDLVIVVDDGSNDTTAKEAEEAGAIVVRHPRNMGKGFAVRTLVKAALKAEAQYAVMLDADGQHNPEDIPKFLEPLVKGQADHAAANRFAHAGTTRMPLLRKIGFKLLALEHALLVKPMPDPFNGYRGFTRRALETLDRGFDPSYGVEVEINHALRNLPTAHVPVKVEYGPASKANMLLQGLNLAWTIAWTWIAHNPLPTLLLAAALYAASTALAAHVAMLFNASRYIRLAYTALALTLPTLASTLAAAAAVALVSKAGTPAQR
jgi:hypothetical protein